MRRSHRCRNVFVPAPGPWTGLPDRIVNTAAGIRRRVEGARISKRSVRALDRRAAAGGKIPEGYVLCGWRRPAGRSGDRVVGVLPPVAGPVLPFRGTLFRAGSRVAAGDQGSGPCPGDAGARVAKRQTMPSGASRVRGQALQRPAPGRAPFTRMWPDRGKSAKKSALHARELHKRWRRREISPSGARSPPSATRLWESIPTPP